MNVPEYLKAHKIDAEELAAVLSERLDRNIGAASIIARGEKAMPKSWCDALGVDFVDVKAEAEKSEVKPKPKRESAGAPAPSAKVDFRLVNERLEALYVMVGKGVGKVNNEPRYELAFREAAPGCANAWVKLAEHDKHVATVLEALTAGGPWGEVLWTHLSLGFSLVVISGKVDIGSVLNPSGATTQNGAAGGQRSESPPDSVD